MLPTCLTYTNDTRFLPFGRSKAKGKYFIDEMYVPVIFKSHGFLEGSDQVLWVHIGKLENPNECFTEYQFSSQLDERFAQDAEILSTKDQIDSIRKLMGLSISDIATILHVSRPTVYQWTDSEIFIRGKNQERLNEIYAICLFWSRKKVGCVGIYLHKKPNNNSKSLIEILKEDKLDLSKIHYLLNQIEQLLMLRKEERDKNEKLLQQHGFEEVDEGELEKNFNANIQTIG